MPKDHQPPSIAVFADESGISKKLLMGLASFQREHEGWLLNLFPASTQAMKDALQNQTYSGILILDYHPTPEDYRILKSSKIPGVLVGCDSSESYGHSLLIDP
jgi:DNA-binding LacI/PurR family transcriptional regulator